MDILFQMIYTKLFAIIFWIFKYGILFAIKKILETLKRVSSILISIWLLWKNP